MFFVVPVVLVVVASFGSKIEGSAGRVTYSNLSLDNYREALEDGFDGTFVKVLLQGMRTTILGTLLCLVIAFPLAYLLATRVKRGKGFVLALLAIPFFTNFLIRTLAWRIVLAPKGFISNTLLDWGLLDSRLDVLDSRLGVQIGVVYNYLPLMIFPLFVALDRLEITHREASKDLFANRLRTFLQITLPLSASGIIAGTMLVFVPLAGDYVTANVLGGTKGNMPGNLVATQFLQSQNPSLGAAIAVILILSILAVAAIGAIVVKVVRQVAKVDHRAGAALLTTFLLLIGAFVLKPSVSSLVFSFLALVLVAGTFWLVANTPERVGDSLLRAWSVVVLVFLYLPIAFVVAHSFNDNKALEVWAGFSTRWYGEMWDNSLLIDSVKSSLSAAVVAALISVVLGTFAGVALARRPGKWTVAFMAILLLVLTTPEIVEATGMQIQFVSFGGILREGLVPLWIGQAIFSIAVVTLIVRARMQGMDDSLEQAANDLYATPVQAFRQITLPLIAPAVLAGGLLAFTFALDNVIISDFVRAPGTNTFPTYVLGQVKTVRKPDIAAMATLLLGVTLLSLVLAAVVLRRSGEDSSKVAATLTGGS